MSLRRLGIALLAAFSVQAAGAAYAVSAGCCCPAMAESAPSAPCGALAAAACCEAAAPATLPDPLAPSPAAPATGSAVLVVPALETGAAPALRVADLGPRPLRSTVLRL